MANKGAGQMVEALIGFAIAIVVFLLFRAIVLWYFKIDQIVSLLTNINGTLVLIQAENKNLEEWADKAIQLLESIDRK
jgi:hypothetical protein